MGCIGLRAHAVCVCALLRLGYMMYADPLYAADMVRFEVALVCINGLLLATGVGLFSMVRCFPFLLLPPEPVS